MFFCASTFSWTPAQVKELSSEELQEIFEASKKFETLPSIPDIVAPQRSPGPQPRPVPSSLLSTEDEVLSFMKKTGAGHAK
jgi:hypothetical protein